MTLAPHSKPLAPQPKDCVSLDLSGKFCPQVVLDVAEFARHHPSGARIFITSTDPLSTLDIPLFAMKQGHTLEIVTKDPPTLQFILTIRTPPAPDLTENRP